MTQIYAKLTAFELKRKQPKKKNTSEHNGILFEMCSIGENIDIYSDLLL